MQRTDVYQIITDRVIALLVAGTVPWHKPWKGGEQLPRNLVSKKAYRGINVFLLEAMSYESPYWVSYKQAESLGGHVKEGEKACPIVFWKQLEVPDKDAPKGVRNVPMLRYYSGFNVGQCEGLKVPPIEGTDRIHDPIAAAENIVAGMQKAPAIRQGASRACYIPSKDTVEIPSPERFVSGETFYSALFHELIHSTGHESRLKRREDKDRSYGSSDYSREELVAEMGAAFLCGQAGIVERTVDNSAAYIANWLERLRSDHKLVVQAAAQAQKASDFVLNIKFTERETT